MTRPAPRRGGGVAAVVAAALCYAAALPARAHEAPAEPPDFAPGECILIVDKAEQEQLRFDYALAYDDVEYTLGDIVLPDGRTHQFFAFRGSLVPLGFGYQFYPFDPAIDQGTELPLWITVDDVKRAAAASDTSGGAPFFADDVPAGAVLQDNVALEGSWLRITADDARVPITLEQAAVGLYWDLATVEPGLYSVAAYVFSPPYNGWAARKGLVKIVDAAQPTMPAAVIDPVHAFVYPGFGRRVRACIDAVPGSRVRGSFRIEERPEEGWTEWLPEREVDGGSLEVCFHHPQPERTGSLRLRLELVSADGTAIAVYSPDTITALRGQGECVPSETICCDASAAPRADAAVSDAAADAEVDAVAGQGGAGSPPERAPGREAMTERGDGGCTASGAPLPRTSTLVLLLGVLLWAARRRAG